MKRSYLKRIGKRGLINLEANRKIKEMFLAKGISECEFRLPDCLLNWTLQRVHRKKRLFYYKTPEMLSSFEQVALGCQKCHEKVENNKELREKEFKRIRGV